MPRRRLVVLWCLPLTIQRLPVLIVIAESTTTTCLALNASIMGSKSTHYICCDQSTGPQHVDVQSQSDHKALPRLVLVFLVQQRFKHITLREHGEEQRISPACDLQVIFGAEHFHLWIVWSKDTTDRILEEHDEVQSFDDIAGDVFGTKRVTNASFWYMVIAE